MFSSCLFKLVFVFLGVSGFAGIARPGFDLVDSGIGNQESQDAKSKQPGADLAQSGRDDSAFEGNSGLFEIMRRPYETLS